MNIGERSFNERLIELIEEHKKICPICLEDVVPIKREMYCGSKCANRAAERQGRQRKKDFIYSFKDGCFRCGYNQTKIALDFHHMNPEEKSFNIGNEGIKKSYDDLEKEISKCVVLCKNCHAELHDDIWDLKNNG